MFQLRLIHLIIRRWMGLLMYYDNKRRIVQRRFRDKWCNIYKDSAVLAVRRQSEDRQGKGLITLCARVAIIHQ